MSESLAMPSARATGPSDLSPASGSSQSSVPIAVRAEREAAERCLHYRLEQRREAIETVTLKQDAAVAEARRRLLKAQEAEAAFFDALSGWRLHDGGACPIDDVPVHFRTKLEWRAMLVGEPMSIDEDGCRYASSLRWQWLGRDHDDIAAYRPVAQAIETRQGRDPQGHGAEHESAVGETDAP